MLRLYFICKTIPSNPSKYLGSPLVEWKLGNRISDVCWALETKAREILILSLPSKGGVVHFEDTLDRILPLVQEHAALSAAWSTVARDSQTWRAEGAQ